MAVVVTTLKDNVREAASFRARALIAMGFVGLLTVAVVVRLAHLQVLRFEHFNTLSEDNRVKIVPVAPTRGLIYDRRGTVLAHNVPTFSLELVPEAINDVEATIAELSQLVDIDEADRQRFERLLKGSRRFEHVPLRLRLSEDEVARFAVNRHRFPGVDVKARLTRHYPTGELMAHLVGYVGRINERELKRLDTARYRASTHIGKTGVEQSYEDLLHGEVGLQHVETNAQGRVLRVLERRDPKPGASLHLNVDAQLQRAAMQALGDERGAVVVLDALTGGVLAFVSQPTFDPNLFVDGIDAKTYAALLRAPGRPLFNRALNGQYPPGSTVKPFLALAGQELGVKLNHGNVYCRGWFSLPGKKHRYRDWKRGGHGKVGLHDAIVQSCDVYYYELALGLGIDRMHEYFSRFGFGTRTGIDLNGESSGLNPSRDWKRAARNQPWYPGETLITGIGQGFFLSTPLQLAHATSTLAMAGVRIAPRVVMRTERAFDTGVGDESLPDLSRIIINDLGNWQRVVDAMHGVVHGKRGTARRIAKDIRYQMAGKTGTAQVFTIGQDEEYDAENLEKRLQDHALFIAFAPVEQPRIAVAVLVENGGSGSRAAAPVAREVIDRFMDLETLPGEKGMVLTAADAPPTAH